MVRRVLGLTVLVVLVTTGLVAPPARAEVSNPPGWAGPGTGGGIGGRGPITCGPYATGQVGRTRIFDPFFWPCDDAGRWSEGDRHVLAPDGYEVWRFYGTKQLGSADTFIQSNRIDAWSVSRLRFQPFGAFYEQSNVFIPDPTDRSPALSAPVAPFVRASGWRADGWEWRHSDGITALHGRLALRPTTSPPFRREGTCLTGRTSLFDEFFRTATTAPPLFMIQFEMLYNRYVAESGGSAALAAAMLNLRHPVADPGDFAQVKAAWDDGVACTSHLEYARPRIVGRSYTQAELVSCYVPVVRRARAYHSPIWGPGYSPYATSYWRYPGFERYASLGAYRPSNLGPGNPRYDLHRTMIFLERLSRPAALAEQPRREYLESPTARPSDDQAGSAPDLVAAAAAAMNNAYCFESTRDLEPLVGALQERETRTVRRTSPQVAAARVEVTAPDVLAAGGTLQPLAGRTFTATATLRCATPTGSCTGPDGLPTTFRVDYQLALAGINGYRQCSAAPGPDCDFQVTETPARTPVQRLVGEFYAADHGAPGVRVHLDGPDTFTVTRRELSYEEERICRTDPSGARTCGPWREVPGSRRSRQVTETVHPTVTGAPKDLPVLGAVHHPGAARGR